MQGENGDGAAENSLAMPAPASTAPREAGATLKWIDEVKFRDRVFDR
jgi:hypothetical protein